VAAEVSVSWGLGVGRGGGGGQTGPLATRVDRSPLSLRQAGQTIGDM